MSKTRSEQHDNRTYRTSVVLGAMALVVGLLASAVLSVDALGLIPALPGCGAQSACDRLTGGVWGRIPLLDVPVSFVGFAYFLAMLVLWFRERSTRALRVVMRLAAVYSLFSIGLMAVLGLWCPWCLAAQGANLVYWFCTGVRSRGSVRPRTGRVVGVLAMSVVVLVLLMVVRQLGRAERAIEAERALAESLQRIAEAEADRERLALLEGRHVIGAAEPAVELVMFTDYQCPDCRRIERQVAAILESQPDVAVVIKHFPFNAACNEHAGGRSPHPNACWAARAAETAALLGGDEGFARMHEWLFREKGSFTDASFPEALRSLGFDPAEFIGIMTSPETLELVRGDTDDAKALGVFFTPMIFVNGQEYTWYYGDEGSLEAAIAAGRERPVVAPPGILGKLVADWSGRAVQPSRSDGQRAARGAGVEVTVYGDYRGGPSRTLDAAIRGLLDSGTALSYRFRHFPVDPDCNPAASGFSARNEGACLDARLVEAVERLHGAEARWRLHEQLMDSGPGADRSELLTGLGLDAAAVLAFAADDDAIQALIRADVEEKVRIWRMHTPVLVVDGRFVPRWQHDEVPPAELIRELLGVAGASGHAPARDSAAGPDPGL